MTPDIRLKSFERASRRSRRILIGIVLAYVGVLLIAPLAALLRNAFADGIAPLVHAVMQPDAVRAFWISLALSAGAILVNAVFGLATAWVLVRHRFPGRKLLNALVDLPFAVSPVVAGYMMLLLSGTGGWLTPIADALGIRIVFSWPGMLIATVFLSLPFVVREVMPLLQEFGRDQEEAAATLGANPWQTFWRVTLPSVRWGLIYGVLLTLARSLGEFGAVYVVGGAIAGRTETATVYVFRTMDERLYTATYGVSLVLAAFTFTLLMGTEFLKRAKEKR